MKDPRLVLFDIDGTLLRTDGVGTVCIVQALEEVFKVSIDTEGYQTSGKTDTQICLELMRQAGRSDDEVLNSLDAMRSLYVPLLAKEIAEAGIEVFPGVRELLDRLSGCENILVGLLTGNIERGARMKVEATGLGDYFSFGAYGDTAVERKELPQRAVNKAFVETGRTYGGKEIVILGDTPNDVECGRSLGVTSIAVATGSYTREELSKHDPDHLFEDFGDTEAVLSAILGEGQL